MTGVKFRQMNKRLQRIIDGQQDEGDLAALGESEWESLCDGCGRCCLHKLEDEESGAVHFTNVACRYLDLASCRCRVYGQRAQRVARCVVLRPGAPAAVFAALPASCAYRTLFEGRPFPDWHPLRSGRRESVVEAGIVICDRAQSEAYVHPEEYPARIIELDID